jgi:hypothetical protein
MVVFLVVERSILQLALLVPLQQVLLVMLLVVS